MLLLKSLGCGFQSLVFAWPLMNLMSWADQKLWRGRRKWDVYHIPYTSKTISFWPPLPPGFTYVPHFPSFMGALRITVACTKLGTSLVSCQPFASIGCHLYEIHGTIHTTFHRGGVDIQSKLTVLQIEELVVVVILQQEETWSHIGPSDKAQLDSTLQIQAEPTCYTIGYLRGIKFCSWAAIPLHTREFVRKNHSGMATLRKTEETGVLNIWNDWKTQRKRNV